MVQSITNILSTSPPWVVNCIWLSIISIACCFYKAIIGVAVTVVFIINKIRLDQAPDAWITFILLVYLQYQQFTRQQIKGKKVHVGSKSKPKHIAIWSLVHEWLFTSLHMLVSPLSNQATEMNADMVDLKNDEDLASYAQTVAAGKVSTKKSNKKTKNKGGSDDKKSGKAIEVRPRRIVRGELAHNVHYPILETTINLSICGIIGITLRWIFGLVRSIRLSSVANNGPCCSPYRGTDDEGTRQSGSFVRLLSCVLAKHEGENGARLILTLISLMLLVCIVKMASSESSDLKTDEDEVEGEEKKKEYQFTGFDPQKVKRFVVGVVATLASLLLFNTPILLRSLGLENLTEAAEEWGARVLLFGNLLGIVSIPKMESLDVSPVQLQTLTNVFFVLLAMVFGYISSSMMKPVNETARNAAHILAPSKEKKNPQEMMDLINARMMLVIQGLAPFMILCTYLSAERFAETIKPARGGEVQRTFSKQYLTNSGLFVRIALAWCFIFASAYTVRALLQSYLDQAAKEASKMTAMNDTKSRRGAKDKIKSSPPVDPFHERYKNIVLTAVRIVAFPAFVLAMLVIAHVSGGDGSTHPGVGHISLPKDAPRDSTLPVRGLLAPYDNYYMSWIAKGNGDEGDAGNKLLHTVALSQASYDEYPMRNSAHKKIVDITFGRNKVCYPPETRSIKAMGRHVDFLLDSADNESEGSILTMNTLTGRELLDMVSSFNDTFECRSEEDTNNQCKAPERRDMADLYLSLLSHKFFTPTIVFPIIDTLAFLSSIWWTYHYSIKMTVHFLKIRK